MKKSIKIFFPTMLLLLHVHMGGQIKLSYEENKTPTYGAVIEMYRYLADNYEAAELIEAGTTDAGKPLHLFLISKHKGFSPEAARAKNLSIIFINNGIHPGESNGIDASLQFASELLGGSNRNEKYLENCILLMVPVFNIGGALNRSAYHRANQNGPEYHGFRGNVKNLDLNRDFVKLETRNARSLVKIIQTWDPDIFLDTHSTNGADYPYTVTLVLSHHQQLEKPQAELFYKKMVPAIMESMNNSPYKTSHYVNVDHTSPEQGFEGFVQYPRYLCGYTTAFHIPSFTIETHMLKPYKERVLSTKYLMEEVLEYVSENAAELKAAKETSIAITAQRKQYAMKWKVDTSKHDLIMFRGYKSKNKISALTGQEMYYYDRNDTWEYEIPFYNYFKPVSTVNSPEFYIIPSAWQEVIQRLELSDIHYEKLKSDTILAVECYYIDDYETSTTPYNGHYSHNNIVTSKKNETISFYAGDIIIPVNQRGNSYIVQTLEPESFDSFFSWNFFDAILSRREYFSPYLFEKTASEFLNENPAVRNEFESLKTSDPAFGSNHKVQLKWIYDHSPWSEPTYMRYPVYRYSGEY